MIFFTYLDSYLNIVRNYLFLTKELIPWFDIVQDKWKKNYKDYGRAATEDYYRVGIDNVS